MSTGRDVFRRLTFSGTGNQDNIAIGELLPEGVAIRRRIGRITLEAEGTTNGTHAIVYPANGAGVRQGQSAAGCYAPPGTNTGDINYLVVENLRFGWPNFILRVFGNPAPGDWVCQIDWISEDGK